MTVHVTWELEQLGTVHQFLEPERLETHLAALRKLGFDPQVVANPSGT